MRTTSGQAGPSFDDAADGTRRSIALLAATVVVILVAGGVLRFGFLDIRQLYKDEGASWLLASYKIPDLLQHIRTETYPPLYPLVFRGWMLLFGDGLATMRTLSALIGITTVAVAWRWGHEALGRSYGVIVLAAVALSGLAIEDAREVRMGVLETACATVAWWLIWRLLDRPGERRWDRWLTAAVLAAAVAGELWTSAIGIPTAALQGACVLGGIRAGRRAGGSVGLIAVAVGCASFLPWLPVLLAVATNGHPFWTPVPGPQLVPYAYDAQFVGRGFRIAALVGGLVLVAAAAVGVLDLVTARGRRAGVADRDRALGWVIACGLALVPAVWAYSLVRTIWDVGYLGNVLGPLALALAAGVRAVAARRPQLSGRVVAAAIAIVVLVEGASSFQQDLARNADQGVMPGVQTYTQLVRLARPDDIVLAINAESYFALDYIVARRNDPLPLAAPLYTWDNGHESWYIGQGLVAHNRLVRSSTVAPIGGWTRAFPGLATGGRVLLVDLEDGDLASIGFEPLADGTLRQLGRIDVSHAGQIAQIRVLAVP